MRNANSPNFPFVISHSFSSNNFDFQVNRKKSNQMQGSLLNSYTNESMDMFRLSSNREANRNGYHNKYYDNIQSIDRSNELKAYENNKNKIKLIDILKSNYKMSQDPNYLRKILSNKESDLLSQKNNNTFEYNFTSRQMQPSEVKRLNQDYNTQNRIPFRLSKIVNKNQLHSSCTCSNISPLYLMNINDYSISEGDKANTERSFIYNMKNYRVKDPIANEVRFVNNKNVIGVGKWSPFYENYSRLRDRGFYRQGGFFSEYVNMHRKEFNEMQKEIDDKREKNRLQNGFYDNYSKSRRIFQGGYKTRRCKSIQDI